MRPSSVGARLGDERGLVGKLLFVWLILLAIVVVIAIDAGSIVRTRFRTSDLAGDASTAAAQAFADTGSEQAAKLAALKAIADGDQGARLKRIDIGSNEVTVVLVAHGDTLVVGSIPYFDQFTKVTVTDSSPVALE